MFGLNENDQNQSQPPTGSSVDEAAMEAPDMEARHGGPSGSPALPLDDTSNGHGTVAPGPSNNELIGIKEKALTNLSPLVGHLEQAPEERFKTLMMLIQASDNSSFIKEAYESANQIQDEKTRAQALLDVVNEINYFTQHPDAKSKN